MAKGTRNAQSIDTPMGLDYFDMSIERSNGLVGIVPDGTPFGPDVAKRSHSGRTWKQEREGHEVRS